MGTCVAPRNLSIISFVSTAPDLADDLAGCIAGWVALRDPAVGTIQILDPDTCVLAVRLATKILLARGHTARALPVGVLHANKTAAAAMSEGVDMAHWPLGADARVVRPGRPPADPEAVWPGHLVVLVPGEVTTILDLTAEQFAMPGAPLRPLLLRTGAAFPDQARTVAWSLPWSGATYQLEDARDTLGRTYRTCGDWGREYRSCWGDFQAGFHDYLDHREAS